MDGRRVYAIPDDEGPRHFDFKLSLATRYEYMNPLICARANPSLYADDPRLPAAIIMSDMRRGMGLIALYEADEAYLFPSIIPDVICWNEFPV